MPLVHTGETPVLRMIYAALNILFVVLFTQALRYSQVRGARDYVAGAVNYVTAAVVAAILAGALAMRQDAPWWPAAPLGAANGASYVGQFLLLTYAYRRTGVGITSAVGAAGIAVPVLTAWLLWGESMTVCRWLALGMVPPAMLLLRPREGWRGHLSWKVDLVLVGVFLNAGLSGTLHKAVNIYASRGADEAGAFLSARPYQIVYQAALFATAAALSTAYALGRRGGLGRSDAGIGAAMGVTNVLATLSSVVGLGVVAAGVFIPTTVCGAVVLTTISSWWLWRERQSARQGLGLLAALAVVGLVNL